MEKRDSSLNQFQIKVCVCASVPIALYATCSVCSNLNDAVGAVFY